MHQTFWRVSACRSRAPEGRGNETRGLLASGLWEAWRCGANAPDPARPRVRREGDNEKGSRGSVDALATGIMHAKRTWMLPAYIISPRSQHLPSGDFHHRPPHTRSLIFPSLSLARPRSSCSPATPPYPALPNSRDNNTHTCLQSNSSASGNLDDAGVHLSPAIFSRHVNTA